MFYTGKDFKDKYKYKFIKLYKKDDVDLNQEDKIDFISHFNLPYLKDDDVYYREVEILDDAEVYENKWEIYGMVTYTVDKYKLSERILIENFSIWNNKIYCLYSITLNIKTIRFVCQDFIIEFLKSHSNLIEYVDPNNENYYKLCEEVILKNPKLIEKINDNFLTEELCLYAVSIKPEVFIFICDKIQTKKICEAAIERPENLIYINDEFLTKELCFKAFYKNPLYYCYVPDKFKTKRLNDLYFRFFSYYKNKKISRELNYIPGFTKNNKETLLIRFILTDYFCSGNNFSNININDIINASAINTLNKDFIDLDDEVKKSINKIVISHLFVLFYDT